MLTHYCGPGEGEEGLIEIFLPSCCVITHSDWLQFFAPLLDLICPLDVIFLLVLSGGSISSVILSAPPSYHGFPQKPSSAVFVRPSLTYLPASSIIMHSDN